MGMLKANTSSVVLTLFGVIRRVDQHACTAENQIHPRYATFHKTCSYIGLRENHVSARARIRSVSINMGDMSVFKVTFTEKGFMHFATSSASPGVPKLHKMCYDDGAEWGCWHFNGPLPLYEVCPCTGEALIHVELCPTDL